MENFIDTFNFDILSNKSNETDKHEFCVKTARDEAHSYLFDYGEILNNLNSTGTKHVLTNVMNKAYTNCYNMLVKYADDFQPPYYCVPFGYLADREDIDGAKDTLLRCHEIILVDLYETTDKAMTLSEFITAFSNTDRHRLCSHFSEKEVRKHFERHDTLALKKTLSTQEQFSAIYVTCFTAYHFKLSLLDIMNNYD
jgi:hypothetical protein